MILTVGSDEQGWVGYQVKTPDHPRYEAYVPGHRAEAYLYTHVREDAFDLYGFISKNEKNFFMTLLSVSGVGPKMALGLLSHADENSLMSMILNQDKEGLTAISGVGKKTAERMILELKDTIAKKVEAGILRNQTSLDLPGSKNSEIRVGSSEKLFIEAYLALQGLGYKEAQAKMMIESALKKNTGLRQVEDVIKQALQVGY